MQFDNDNADFGNNTEKMPQRTIKNEGLCVKCTVLFGIKLHHPLIRIDSNDNVAGPCVGFALHMACLEVV